MTDFNIQTAIRNMIDQLEEELSEVGFEIYSVHLGENLYNDYVATSKEDIAPYVTHEWILKPDEWYLTYVVRAETETFTYEQMKEADGRVLGN